MEIVIGLLIGLAIGTTGVGGGTLTAPALILLMGYDPRRAVATALIFAGSVKLWTAIAYVVRSQVRFRILAFLLSGGIPGAILGTIVLDRLAVTSANNWVLCGVGAVVMGSALLSLIGLPQSAKALQRRQRLLPLLAFPIGLESGFSSSGSGALGTVMLFRFTSLSPAEVVGTDIAFGFVICGLAGIMQAASGNCDMGALVRLVPAGIAGSIVGVLVNGVVPAKLLRKSLLICVTGIGLSLLIKGIGGIL